MTNNVVEFTKKEKYGCGHAICIGCRHKWVAVAPVGTTHFDCPNCLTEKGRWRYEFQPSASESMMVCACGNDLFHITPTGHLCPNCGIYQEY